MSKRNNKNITAIVIFNLLQNHIPFDRVDMTELQKKCFADDVNIRSGTLSQITLKVAYFDFVSEDLYNNIYDLGVLQCLNCLNLALNKLESCIKLTFHEVQM